MERKTTTLLFRGWTLAFAAGSLIACATLSPAEFDPDSKIYPPPLGTRVIVQQEIPIAAGKARVTLQKGELSERGVHPFDIWCQFEVEDLTPVVQTILPGEFVVHKVTQEFTSVVFSGWSNTVAQWGQRANDGPSDITRIRHMWLQSTDQPNVRRLSCGGVFERPSDASFPSFNEIRRAVGRWVALELPAG